MSIILKTISGGTEASAVKPKSNGWTATGTACCRNWVIQTGVQLLTGFLLTLPFQQRFDVLSGQMRVVYLATVGCSVSATVLLIAPVATHRLLFRRQRLQVLVSAAHRFAYAGLLLLGAALTGMTVIVFTAVSGRTAGVVAGLCAVALFTSFWLVMPLLLRDREF